MLARDLPHSTGRGIRARRELNRRLRQQRGVGQRGGPLSGPDECSTAPTAFGLEVAAALGDVVRATATLRRQAWQVSVGSEATND